MNSIKYILCFTACILISAINAQDIPFDGDAIHITGSFEQLAIHGSETTGQVNITDLLTGASLLQTVKHKATGKTLDLEIKGNTKIRIDVPKSMNIKCTPTSIIYDGSYVRSRDAHNIHILNTEGEIEVNADGYRVQLYNTSGSISVVTYEDIKATLPYLQANSIVSLDSYTGEVLLRIPDSIDPKIKAKAKNGKVTIGFDDDNFNQKNKGTGNQVLLHSEKGKWVNVKSIKELPNGPTHPELRDELIEMYIHDQGKIRMANISRTELTGMGYGAIIEAMDDVYKGQLYMKNNKDKLDRMVDEYGIPTEEMVGNDYALSAVRLTIFQSKPDYFNKYKERFRAEFGSKWVEIYERMHKTK